MGEFDYSDDRSMATVEFPAHKFPYTASVYYECNIRLCTLNEEKCKKVRNLIIFCGQHRNNTDSFHIHRRQIAPSTLDYVHDAK